MAGTGRIEVVAFDCDSTLSTLEGIDELARRAGAGSMIAALTAEAMDGRLDLETVYGRRISLVRPGRDDLAWLGGRYLETLVPGAGEVVAALLGEGREVHIISGGLRQPVEALAAVLGLPATCVHAVEVQLDEHGRFSGWDHEAPTARSGGKGEVLAAVARGRRAVMVGDGITDLEAQAAGVRVIGFGGVAIRARVRERADAWVAGPSLVGVLDLVHAWDGAPDRQAGG